TKNQSAGNIDGKMDRKVETRERYQHDHHAGEPRKPSSPHPERQVGPHDQRILRMSAGKSGATRLIRTKVQHASQSRVGPRAVHPELSEGVDVPGAQHQQEQYGSTPAID